MARVRIAHVPGQLSATRATRAEHGTLGWSHGCFRGPPRGGGWHGPHVIACHDKGREGGARRATRSQTWHVRTGAGGESQGTIVKRAPAWWQGWWREGARAPSWHRSGIGGARATAAQGLLPYCYRARATHYMGTTLRAAPFRTQIFEKVRFAPEMAVQVQASDAQADLEEVSGSC